MEVIELVFPYVFLVGIGAVVILAVVTGVALRAFIGLIKDLTDQNARTMMFISSMNDRNTREHNEIISAIECLTEKIKAMVGKRAYQVGGDG